MARPHAIMIFMQCLSGHKDYSAAIMIVMFDNSIIREFNITIFAGCPENWIRPGLTESCLALSHRHSVLDLYNNMSVMHVCWC